jgi:catechol 2,3-dioxygenase-like lactoylglutathione lyase family enzyme
MLDIPLTPAQERALRRLVSIFDQAGACYQFTGGFAGNLHGSRWPLHDLDVDVAKADLPRLAELLQPVTTQPLGLFQDQEFELQLLRAEMDGVAIDVCQAEDGFACVGGRRVPLNIRLERRQRARVLDLEVWVQPLEDLIAYKELLGRSADLAELRQLQAQSARRVHVASLDHLVLTVRDLDATVRFYESVLGMQTITFGANRKALAFGTQKINLHEAGKEFEPKAALPTPGSADLCFLTSAPLEKVMAHLCSLGVPVLEGPVRRTGATGPIRSVYVRDPDGNLIEIANQQAG